jgi:hypothetical protein
MRPRMALREALVLASFTTSPKTEMVSAVRSHIALQLGFRCLAAKASVDLWQLRVRKLTTRASPSCRSIGQGSRFPARRIRHRFSGPFSDAVEVKDGETLFAGPRFVSRQDVRVALNREVCKWPDLSRAPFSQYLLCSTRKSPESGPE